MGFFGRVLRRAWNNIREFWEMHGPEEPGEYVAYTFLAGLSVIAAYVAMRFIAAASFVAAITPSFVSTFLANMKFGVMAAGKYAWQAVSYKFGAMAGSALGAIPPIAVTAVTNVFGAIVAFFFAYTVGRLIADEREENRLAASNTLEKPAIPQPAISDRHTPDFAVRRDLNADLTKIYDNYKSYTYLTRATLNNFITTINNILVNPDLKPQIANYLQHMCIELGAFVALTERCPYKYCLPPGAQIAPSTTAGASSAPPAGRVASPPPLWGSGPDRPHSGPAAPANPPADSNGAVARYRRPKGE